MKWQMMVCVLALVGCERVVAVDLPEGPKRLVVEARLERVEGRVTGDQRIRLTTTDAFFSRTLPPAARGATVTVTDDRGGVVALSESAEPGVYTTSALVIEVGRTYTLRIGYDGNSYTSTSQVQAPVAIDSLYFAEPSSGPVGPATGARATIDLLDPARSKDYYLWEQSINGVALTGTDSVTRGRPVAEDVGFDGLSLKRFQPFDGYVVPVGGQVVLRQMRIPGVVYTYYRSLNDQVANGGTPFDVPLTSVRGNVLNATDPSRVALGYFFAAAVVERRATRLQ
jgi:hypothetical protein